jgi:hypothetical protein
MPRTENSQFNVRSSFARARAHELAELTGMTATEVVEDALRGYVPPGAPAKVGRLVQRGAILYDLLIGQSAAMSGIAVIVTWNTAHMRGLFPTLTVATPTQFMMR